jgi:hypothetical protein
MKSYFLEDVASSEKLIEETLFRLPPFRMTGNRARVVADRPASDGGRRKPGIRRSLCRPIHTGLFHRQVIDRIDFVGEREIIEFRTVSFRTRPKAAV